MSDDDRRPSELPEQVPLSGVRAEFRAALSEEIEAAKRAAASSTIALVDGRKIARLADAFQYVFSAISSLNVPSDAPGELLVSGREPLEVIVISVEGLDVTLSVSQDLGDRVPKARLKSDLVFLLKRLISRIEETRNEPNTAGDCLLDGGPAEGVPEAIDDPLLNDTQDAALASSVGRNITFIWGPPGTGKTQTIGAIGEQLYRRGRSALIVSHTNTAVDQALLKVAEQLGGDLGAGKVIRAGVPSDQRLREREDLLLDGAVRERQRALRERQAELREDKQVRQARIGDCQRLVGIASWAAAGEAELVDLRSRLAAVQQEEEAGRSIADELRRKAEGEAELRAGLAEAEAAARSATEADRLRAELPRLDEELEASRERIRAAESAVAAARRDHEKAIELAPLIERERALPRLDDHRRAVDALAFREAEAKQEVETVAAALREAEEVLLVASQANAIQRRFRRLPKPEVQQGVVADRRGEVAAARARLDGIGRRLHRQAEILAELEELDGQLAPWRNLASQEEQEALLRRRESEREAAAATVAELEEHRVQVDRELADAVEAARAFEAARDAAPDAVVVRIRAQLDELRRLRERLRTTERRAAERRGALGGNVRTRLAAVKALGLIEERPPAAAEQGLEEIARAHAEARELAASIDSEGLTAEIADHEREIRAIDEELVGIDEELEAIRRAVIAEAMVVATTLTRAYLWNEIQERRFDTVILDEASMAPIPALWIAARLARRNVVVVGDPMQLPPIKHSEHELAEKWLGTDIFDVSGVRDAAPAHLVQLNEQYRMDPQISAIPNALVYENKLHDAPSAGSGDGLDGWYRHEWGHDAPVLLVDTGSTNAWVSSVTAGGRASRLNFLSAVVSVDLAERLLADEAPQLSLGAPPCILIATPYRAQARLLGLLIRDAGLSRVVEAGTAHAFQGSEAPVVIFDLTIDEPHWRVGLCIPEFNESSTRLVNVALTRARDRLLIVGDFAYVRKIGKRSFVGGRLLAFIEERYPKVAADDIVPVGLGARAARAQTLVAGGTVEPIHEREVMTQADVFPRLYADLGRARERIVIYSPFMTENRFAEVLPHLQAAIERGARVYVFTKAPDDRGKREIGEYGRMEEQLAAVGATVIHKPGMHEKLVFVDDRIAWAGSLNVLSFRNTQEWMGRWESREVVEDFTRPLALGDVLGLYEADNARCPICDAELVPAEGLQGLYWRCIVKGCYTQDLDRPVPRDGLLRCASHGCDGDVEFYDGGKRPVWRCTTNKRHRQQFHPNHLSLPRMRNLIIAASGKRGLQRLDREYGAGQRDGRSTRTRAEADYSPGEQTDLSQGTDGDTGAVTAVELARRLGKDPRSFRAWLRSRWRAGHPILKSHRLNDPWRFTPGEADQLAAEFRRTK